MLAVAVAALVAPSTAMASACGDEILADWFDNGRIDRVYEIECYSEAIDSIPPDIRDYANAEEVIARALQRRSDPDDPSNRSAGLPGVDTSSPSAIPIPLLLLAAMAILLLGAGGLGYLSRRRNGAVAGDAADGPDDDEIQG